MASEAEEHEPEAVDAKAVRRHVEALHGGYEGDAEFVVHFRKGGRPAQYDVPRDEEHQLAHKVSRLVGEGADAYITVCRFSPGRKPNTRKAIDAQVVPGVWADIDVKPNVETSIHDADELDRVLDALPEPTLLVGSGSGGIHPYWLLDEPSTDTDRMHELAKGWIKYIAAVATNVLGRPIKVDSVGDLARILRLAGTRRSDGRMVELIHDDGPRYSISELEELITPEPQPEPKPRKSATASKPAAAGIEVAMARTEADEFVMDGLDLDELREHGVPDHMLHDKTLSRVAYKLCGQGVSRREAREIWGEICAATDPKKPRWAFGWADFERHWDGAVSKLGDKRVTDEDNAAMAAEGFEDDVLGQIRYLKVNREAKRRIDEDDFTEPPEAGSLADQQDDPEPAPSCIVEDIIPRDGIVMLNAALKSGKTTLVSVNLACDLASDLGVDRDDTPKFLGAFPVDFPEGCIGIWNLEVGAGQLQRWLFARELAAEAAARIFPMHLRGRGVDLLVPAWEAWAIGWLRGHGVKVWIIDPQSKLLKNEIDASEYNAFWKALERIKEQAGVDLVILIHHTGNPTGDGDGMPRARGTSAMGGNADVLYTYRHGGALGELPPAGETRRYFYGFGRDIAFPREITLDFDADSGRLTVATDSQGRAADKALREARRAYEVVKAYHDDTGETMNATEAKTAIGGKPAIAVRALARCVREGWLTVAAGPRSSKLYTPKPGEVIL